MMDSLKNSPNASGMKWKPFLASIHKAFLNQELSSSQKQAVITGKKKKKTRDTLRIGNLYIAA